ncbi:hypothetical protein J5226_21595 [Lysobacter sp. K5869]|uniref:hypothetical protein n=1 Tax=Lysobacter sp. K5869 TaxID=2820808 RepID=UPI001C05F781|nr:hypothetical protein [Lysobacter sp. K5869]QWP76153.1 hypothetical protein J5226_21595 [Lysobacter sp. K5869]
MLSTVRFAAARKPLAWALLAASVVSASAGAAGPATPPSPVSVTSYYSDAARTALVGVSFYGDCPEIVSGQLIGQSGPYSDTVTVMCDQVGNVPLPF